MDSLAMFYESCAQIEVDEYRDYDKALQVGGGWSGMEREIKFDSTSLQLVDCDGRV
jgi:hypothetical protein